MPGSIPSISGDPPLPLCFPNKCNNCSDSENLAVLMNFFCIPDSSAGKEFACSSGDPCSIPGSGRSPRERIVYMLQYSWASLVAQLVKNTPAMQETWGQSLGWDDPRRRERVPTPVFLPGELHGLYSPWGCKESDKTEQLSLSLVVTRLPLTSGDFLHWSMN